TGNFYRPFLDYCDWARQRGQSLNYPIGGYTETAESFQAAPGRPDRFFSLDPAGRDRRPAGEYLVGYGRGYYGEADAAAARLLAYAREHGLKLAGPVYQIYLFDELVLREEDKFLLQIAVRLAGPGK
ncbi:MAG: hypothetical protein LBT60_01260, partial [Oscillospiraceae bacterium]|nr:hypothetical protein [Oscillospiraceae bacterium]